MKVFRPCGGAALFGKHIIHTESDVAIAGQSAADVLLPAGCLFAAAPSAAVNNHHTGAKLPGGKFRGGIKVCLRRVWNAQIVDVLLQADAIQICRIEGLNLNRLDVLRGPVEFQDKDRIELVPVFCGEGDFDPFFGLGKTGLPSADHGDFLNFCGNCRQKKFAARSQPVDIDLVFPKSRNAIDPRKERASARGVNAFPVFFHPLADFLETRELLRVDLAIGTGTHIEQKVPIPARRVYEQADAFFQWHGMGSGLVAPSHRKAQ